MNDRRFRRRSPIGTLLRAALLISGTGACTAQSPIVAILPPPPPPDACGRPDLAPPGEVDAIVSIDGTMTHQRLDGFGTSTRLFDDPHFSDTSDPATGRGAVVVPAAEAQRLMSALYRDLGLTRARYATDPGVEVVNDNADPDQTDLARFDFRWKRLDGHIDYMRAAQALGLRTWYGSPIQLESWMSRTDPSEYIEWAFVIIQRWHQAGMTLPYWAIDNEPGGQGRLGSAFLRDATKGLGARLAAAGIPTRLVIPDDATPALALNNARVILGDPVARRYVAAIAFHLYEGADAERLPNFRNLDQLVALAGQYNLPLWMSEWYTRDWWIWATTMHELLTTYNVSAIDYLWGAFGEWDGRSAELITVTSSGTSYTGFRKNKQFWVMGQYSAHVPVGSVRINAMTADTLIRASAWQHDNATSMVALNTGDASRRVRFDFGPGTRCPGSITGSRTSATENGVALGPVQLDRPWIVLDLPGRSITTITVR